MKTTVGDVELELWEKETPKNDRLLYPPRLLKCIILNNPFSDIIPRIIVQECEEVKDSSETETAAVQDFNLLSFGEKAEKDEEESVILNKKFSDEGKSAHDHLSDSRLSSQPAVEPPELANKKIRERRSSDWENHDEVKTQEELEVVKKEKELVYCIQYNYVIERIIVQQSEEVKDNLKTKTAAVKDFNLLSFGGEAKEDEEESVILNKKFTGTGKSVHDHLTDPKYSSQPAVEPPRPPNKKRKKDCNSDWGSGDEVQMCRNIYGNLENTKAARIMELWHVMDYIGLLKPMSKGGKSSTPDLQNKHTIFGRVTGESIYSMLKLEEALVNEVFSYFGQPFGEILHCETHRPLRASKSPLQNCGATVAYAQLAVADGKREEERDIEASASEIFRSPCRPAAIRDESRTMIKDASSLASWKLRQLRGKRDTPFRLTPPLVAHANVAVEQVTSQPPPKLLTANKPLQLPVQLDLANHQSFAKPNNEPQNLPKHAIETRESLSLNILNISSANPHE
ncbi:Peptidyl-prolyl cis-trans isomerase CWC27 like protein [Eufriesea mexicana]|uniref:Peptidyl-prolyl cis-trans isomerase CWC27 like protein n=1 Tax=Eufriesea mexicana TaxID=516756 RepID=A0A310SIZ9_9HYME|nr:Peptidyl-prolyl cis-trans isomerase CWC27 like protein [Eufriesea mexicana]